MNLHPGREDLEIDLGLLQNGAAPREVELKLELTPDGTAALIDHPLLRDALSEPRQNDSVYYDTKKGALRTAGVSLRVRRIGDRFVQTVKSGAKAAAGLFDRFESEEPIAGPQPELEKARAVAPMLENLELVRDLNPVFETRIARRSCTLDRDGARIEVVLDQGEVVAGKHKQLLAEVELELITGSPAALFGLAREIQEFVPLTLGVLTKSERGARLSAGKASRATKAEPLRLTPEMSVIDGFRTIAFSCLRHFRANEPLVVSARDVDALHQSRVALRRLRSAFSLFKPVLQGDSFEPFRDAVRDLAVTLGTARNFDVLLARRSEALPKEIRRKLIEQRSHAYDQAIATLQSAATRSLMIDLAEWITIGEPPDAGKEPLRPFADDVLHRFWKKVKQRGRELRKLDDKERHELRIAGKKLRYAAEFFVGLYSGDRSERRDAFLSAIGSLQDGLGSLNDLATERDLVLDLATLGIALPRRPSDLVAAQTSQLLDRSEEAYRELREAGSFWR